MLRPDLSTLKFLGALAGKPGPTLGRVSALAGELTRIARGTSSVAPAKRDRRFADPAWTENPVLRRIVAAYLAAGRTAEELVADADLGWRDRERTSFLVANLVEAAAPSNNPLLSPVAWKAAIDSGGVSVLKGFATWPRTWPPRRGCRPWWRRTRSGWAWTSRSPPATSCCAPRCSS